MERAKAEYVKPEYRDFYKNSCLVESEGYCQWPRVKEIAEFCKKNGFTKIGVAFCTGLRQEAKAACEIFRNHGLEVVSVMCTIRISIRRPWESPKRKRCVPALLK